DPASLDRVERLAARGAERFAARKLEIGAEHRARLLAHLALHVGGEALDRDERRDAERDRGQEQKQALAREAALPPRERQELERRHAAAAVSATIAPSASLIVRRARSARIGSCVTRTSVVPSSRLS